MNRRDLFRTGSATAAAFALTPWCGKALAPAEAQTLPPPVVPPTTASPDEWSFVHITDIHIQPTLGASEAVARAFDAIRALPQKPEFALIGGDLIFDGNKNPLPNVEALYDLWQHEAQHLGLPLHYTCGNHDGYGMAEAASKSAAMRQNPDFGKGLWKRRLGLHNSYGFFDLHGWRFVQLDSVAFEPNGYWEGRFDDDQIQWLDDLLRRTPREMPVVFSTHIPILTLYAQITRGITQPLTNKDAVRNGRTFLEMIQKHHVPAVFQGHTHIVEECRYLNTRFITGGAICGEWWKGPRLGLYPEGFTVVTVKGGELSWRYVPYGWDAKPYLETSQTGKAIAIASAPGL